MTNQLIIRVLHVVSGDLWAGAEVMVAALLSALARTADIEVHAVVLNRGELERKLRAIGIPVTVLDETQLSSMSILSGLRALIRATDPDVVHTHRTKENVLGGLAAHLEGRRPSLRTVHGAAEHAAPVWRLDKVAQRTLDNWAARRWQQSCVAVSTDLAARLESLDSRVSITVIRNGLDPNQFAALRAKRAARIQQGRRRFVFLGRLVPVKRLDRLLRAVRLLEDDSAGRLELLVYGDGPLRIELEQLTQELRLRSVVTFLGHRADAVECLADADALVFSSDHEGTPMAALEALAIGVPVVATPVGGLVELLQETPGCRLANDLTSQALAEAMIGCLQAPLQAAPALPDRYCIDRTAAEYVALYRKLLQQRC